ncbi:MAG: DUF2461 domain-containing protein [Spirosomaceae bacterium]|nr:DUF2461 domain-containing protein [Spirosomataceae bacterium]
MNKKEYIWNFLADLEKNNSKEWMDENRQRYNSAKQYWLDEVASVLKRLSAHDSSFEQFQPKDIITRINNNRMFHPDKPIYKGHFSCSPAGKADELTKVFFAFGPEFTMIGGGLYRPDNKALKSIREAIDFDADGLTKILNDKKLIEVTGGLAEDENKLKTSPKGYSNDHPHVDLLRYKSFTAQYTPLKKDIINADLATEVERVYLAIQPLVNWLQKAISV